MRGLDPVRLRVDDDWQEVTPSEFFALPLSRRIQHIVERTVQFRRGGEPVDTSEALAELHRLQS